MTPRELYQYKIESGEIETDACQLAVVGCLDELYNALMQRQATRKQGASVIRWLAKRLQQRGSMQLQGLYLWGGVGRGKTFLMDLFYDCLPFEDKRRTHFHRFMHTVHRHLAELEGEKNPLEQVAARIAEDVQVLCFDEFFVSDIGDAMLLAGLFEKLLELNVVLLATSNIPPSKLYENGLQRQRFLPAIELILQHCKVVEVDSGIDYRLRTLSKANLYHCPANADSERELAQAFVDLAPDRDSIKDKLDIEINDRSLSSIKLCEDVVWFSFEQICGGARSAADYVELAKMFHAVLISGLPQLDSARDDQARRLISLVDEFYDRNVKLILSAAVEIPQIYQGSLLKFEFQRTESRLLEMQSHAFLGRPHKG